MLFYYPFTVFDVATVGGFLWITNDCNKLRRFLETHVKLYLLKPITTIDWLYCDLMFGHNCTLRLKNNPNKRI